MTPIMKRIVSAGSLVAACFAFHAAPAAAGTCRDPGAKLTPQEVRNVKAACEQMAAAIAGWADAAEGRRRLEAILADDFKWFVPVADPSVQQYGTRETYVQLVIDRQFNMFKPGSKVEIFATTAQGNRVATEMIADIYTKEGEPYTNRYQQLFFFDDAGKIREYRLYQDSEIHNWDYDQAIKRNVLRFFEAMSSSGTALVRDMLADDATWEIRRAGNGVVSMDRAEAVAELDKLQNEIGGLHFDVKPENIVIQGERVAVEATSTGTTNAHQPYSNVYHFMLLIKNMKIARVHQYGDTQAAFAQTKDMPSKLY